jgi:hypothetical protein
MIDISGNIQQKEYFRNVYDSVYRQFVLKCFGMYFSNPQITAFFRAFAQSCGKKAVLHGVKSDKKIVLPLRLQNDIFYQRS